MAQYTLEEIEQEIYDTYRYFAENAPGVTPQETGSLGALWALFDIHMAEGAE